VQSLLPKLRRPGARPGGKLLLRCRRRRLGQSVRRRAGLPRPDQGPPDQRIRGRLVVTSCQNCRDQMLSSLNREFNLNVEVQFLWELVANSLIMEPRP
jgi:hypothetical protein